MNQEAKDTMFKAIEDEDFVVFSKAVKLEIDRKVREHPMTTHHQDEYAKFKSIEDLYAKAKAQMNDTPSE
jgi:hypothetical protein